MAERIGLLYVATLLSAYNIVPPTGKATPESIQYKNAFVRFVFSVIGWAALTLIQL